MKKLFAILVWSLLGVLFGMTVGLLYTHLR